LWGWVPFGIGATRSVAVDGRYVAVGVVVGALLGVAALCVIRACFKVTATCVGRPDLCACDAALDEEGEEAASQYPLLVPCTATQHKTQRVEADPDGGASLRGFTTSAERAITSEF